MTESAFMVVPIQQPQTAGTTPIEESPVAPDTTQPRVDLESQIRARLDAGPDKAGFEVEFMAGIDAWTVRLPGTHSAASLRSKLQGLPVEVADDQQFFAI